MSRTKVRSNLPTAPEALTKLIRSRMPRASAKAEIVESSVPMRTCYETMQRLAGPVDSVLDYASALFFGEETAPTHPTPPLAIEEAHVSEDGETLTLTLSLGSFTTR